MIKTGFAIHVHHDELLEYCWDYDKRVEVIKVKPIEEREIRLRLFKVLPKKALKDIPVRIRKACNEREKAKAKGKKINIKWDKTYAKQAKAFIKRENVYIGLKKAWDEWEKAYEEWENVDAEGDKICDEQDKAFAEWEKAYAEWRKRGRETFHKKWCGCKEWNGTEIVFYK